MSIAKYFIARSLYDGIAQWGKSDSTILDREQYVISPGEFYAQHIELDSDCQVEVSVQVQRGQDVEVVVSNKADFEWAMRENEAVDMTDRAVVDGTRQSMELDLEKGNHTIYMAPLSGNGQSSQVELSAQITGSGGWNGNSTSNKEKLGWTAPIAIVLLLSPIGYPLSGTIAFMPFEGAVSGPVSFIVFLTFYALIHFPLLFGVYLDARSTRKVSDFPKNLRGYMIGFLIPLINLPVLMIYVIQRWRTRI